MLGTMDSSDSKYAWLSTVNVANFVTVKLSPEGDSVTNYKIWKEQMTCLLQSQGVAGLVEELPPEKDEPEKQRKLWRIVLPPENEESAEVQRKLWSRTDKLVKGWILGSMSKEVLNVVWEKETAREVWLELEKLFKEEEPKKVEDYGKYLPLYKAAQRGDLESAKNFFQGDIDQLSTTFITPSWETALVAAILIGDTKANRFVRELVRLMPRDALALKDKDGDTALHYAAIVGNTEAASYIVDRNPDLIYMLNDEHGLPVRAAAVFCRKETLKFLIAKHENDSGHKPLLFDCKLGVDLLSATIASECVDIALRLARRYPNLAVQIDEKDGNDPLSTLAEMDTLFPRTEAFTWWRKFIYHRIPSKHEAYHDNIAWDIANSSSNGEARENSCTLVQIIRGVGRKLESIILNILEKSVPDVKKLREKKTKRKQALELVDCLCNHIVTLNKSEAPVIFKKSILAATRFGISEIVERIIYNFPTAYYCTIADTEENVLLLAARYREENIINLFHNMSNRKNVIFNNIDKNRNNLLHKCGYLAPPERLNLVAGAALQMQRELQWFKEMENFIDPSRRTWPNGDGKTPQVLFTEEHKKLKEDGERWMKDTANACTIAAALIATVMFAAAFTVPGGIESASGIPLFTAQAAFEVFAVADAISLFTSITSLLMFLSILTSRYAEQDFLYVLPKRLGMGLISLFMSISFMLVAFTATLYLLLQTDGHMTWFVILVAAFACFPVASFVLLQFPLLVDVISSTYGPGIFGKKKSSRYLY